MSKFVWTSEDGPLQRLCSGCLKEIKPGLPFTRIAGVGACHWVCVMRAKEKQR